MSDKRILLKKGMANYKEKKLVDQIRMAIDKKAETNPEIWNSVTPVKDLEGLQKMYFMYAGETVQHQDLPDHESLAETLDDYHNSKIHTNMAEETKTPTDESQPAKQRIDPMNREEPIVREYVQDHTFGDSSGPNPQNINREFAEPLDFDTAFEFPSQETGTSGTPNSNQGGGGGNVFGQPKQPQKPKGPEPVNPDFAALQANKKRRSVQRLAKYIVNAVVVLQEKGFVWYANKDINEAKLAEYELNNEMDLSILLTLTDGQQTTVHSFFAYMCQEAEKMAKIDADKIKDLTDALVEVMLEKNIGPTPSQELALIGLSILAEQGLSLMVLKAQTSGVLAQLRTMNKSETVDYQNVSGHKQEPTATTHANPEPKRPAPANEVVEEFEVFEKRAVPKQVEEMIAKEEAALSGGAKKKEPVSPIIETEIQTVE